MSCLASTRIGRIGGGPSRLADTTVRVSLVSLLLMAASPVRTATLASWDLPTATATSAPLVGSASSGLTVSAITPGTMSNVSSSSGWRWASLLNSSTVDPASMTTKAFEWTFTTSPRTTASITQLFQTGTVGTIAPEGTGFPTSLQLWAQTVSSGGTSSWSQVGSSVATTGSAVPVSLNTAFFSGTSPYDVQAGTTVTFKLVPLGATGGSASPKIKWISTATSAADLSLIGTTGGGAWDMFWAGGASGTWNYVDASWLKDNTGSSQAFVAGDNATIATAAAIALDPAGISVGVFTASATSGTTTLSGGSLAAGSLVKSGAGTLVLSSSNSFVSGGAVSGGVVQIDHANALGTVATSFNGATLTIGNGVTTVGTPFTVGTAA